ncbi:putative formate transporter 1 [Nocardioides dokdonensis FR1436]|uniref:Putative formate transporter 1 n=1 Tax=Nocardioides dokdonensis FR1436 TaxID=1300347 RepID=A0A1A9GQ47_9ACTN|nr:formate/nitrite transporter family protein [Nocardioides dokdonensis]ANH39601.1 putative formate transporter 1 [Nocardioides dokdonensis FR1436]
MTGESETDLPPSQFVAPERVLIEMAEAGAKRACGLRAHQVLVLSVMAGGFITIGALFSTLIATGTDNEGVQRLLEGFGFSVGFFLVVLSGALLFTEVNVELPATLLGKRRDRLGLPPLRTAILKLWLLAAIGNMIGAFVLGQVIVYVSDYGAGFEALLDEVMSTKMRFQDVGGAEGFFQAVLSGVVANWLVGMAAFLATMGRTIIGKYIPVLITVMAFVAGGFLHAPANMAYLSLSQPLGYGPGWGDGLLWSVLPAAIGNIIGAFFLVALPFYIAGNRQVPDETDDGHVPA